MLVAIISFLALIGGAAVTFFIMDGPRRRNQELSRVLHQERDVVRREQYEMDDRARKLSDRANTLAAKTRELQHAMAALTQRSAEFDRRVIKYDDLTRENTTLKADLQNISLLVAQREFRANEIGKERAKTQKQRDTLAEAYLEEVKQSVRKSLSVSNFPASKKRIEQALQELAEQGFAISPALRQQMDAELRKLYEMAVRASIEREEQAKIREQIREEQRLERERREAIEQAENERKAIEQALNQALKEAAGRHAEEVDRLRAMLAEAEAKSVRAIALAQITKVGYVYIISNLGSFGPDVVKIGLTRREDPQERIDELGSASVPFPFDVHLFIRADDAPKLENALHRFFRKRRVNRANPRKEFFRVTIAEIEAAVQSLVGITPFEIKHKADAAALEFMQSQAMTDEEMEEVDKVFDEVAKETVLTGIED